MNLPQKPTKNKTRDINYILFMSLTKQNKSKNKTKNNNNKKRATKNGMQSHQLSKQHPLPI